MNFILPNKKNILCISGKRIGRMFLSKSFYFVPPTCPSIIFELYFITILIVLKQYLFQNQAKHLAYISHYCKDKNYMLKNSETRYQHSMQDSTYQNVHVLVKIDTV